MDFFRGLFLAFLISLTIAMIIMFGGRWLVAHWDDMPWQNDNAIEQVIGNNGFDTKEQLELARKLHKYHGTNYSWTEHGKEWFYRDGKRVELWNPDER